MSNSQGLTAPVNENKNNVPLLEAGIYPAYLHSIVDVGLQESQFGIKPNIVLVFELPFEREIFFEEAGPEPRHYSRTLGFSMYKDSALRQVVNTAEGRVLSDAEATTYDLTRLLNFSYLVTIEQYVNRKGELANAISKTGISKLTDSTKQRLNYDWAFFDAHKPKQFVFACNEANFISPTYALVKKKWLQEMIATSQQAKDFKRNGGLFLGEPGGPRAATPAPKANPTGIPAAQAIQEYKAAMPQAQPIDNDALAREAALRKEIEDLRNGVPTSNPYADGAAPMAPKQDLPDPNSFL